MSDGVLLRRLMPFERNFTQLPNSWIRDPKLSPKAVGVLAYLMSHEHGWRVSIGTLAKDRGVGRDYIRGAVLELEAAGYLIRRPGRMGMAENWEICDPTGLSDPALIGYAEVRRPVDKRPVGKSNPSENPTATPSDNPTTLRTPVKNKNDPAQPYEGGTSPVDNDASGDAHQPASAVVEWCSNGHQIIDHSASGVPICDHQCSPAAVSA